MSLLINIFDKYNKKIINEQGPYVLIDESLSFIKFKLFGLLEGIQYYPNFLKFEYYNKKTNEYTIIKNNNPIILNITESIQNENIDLFYTNIIDVIEKDYNSVELYQLINTDKFEELLNNFKNDFLDLTREDLEFAIKINIIKNDPELFNLQSQIQLYISEIIEKKQQIENKIKPLYSKLKEFYSLAGSTNFENYIEYDTEKNIPKIKFNQVSLNIVGKNFESGIKGKFIKINRIFNIFELSKKMPFIAFNTSTETDPIVKVYNELLNNVTEKEMKSWILNERKKQSLVTYKKIKGLVIKYNIKDNLFLTINLYDNGIINAKMSLSDEYSDGQYTFENIINYMKVAVDDAINYINSLDAIFSQSKRINNIADSVITIDSLTTISQTTSYIEKDGFSTVLFNPVISENIFELKETLSLDILSIYYKKIKDLSDDDSDKKGLTINIKDNPYKLSSSIIQIFSASNINQILCIIKQIILINIIYESSKTDDTSKRQKLKEKSHIKELRKEGVQILSTKCQKPRQPIILKKDEEEPDKIIDDTYTLNCQDRKYICPKKDYPYPGFTNENIVCCFKKDQRRRDAFIRNIKSHDFEIIVQPSNFKITIKEPISNKEYQTHAIKVISDYIEGFDETNAMSRYFYLSNDNKLINITNQVLINTLKNNEENGIWLDSIPLARIINEPPKNKCNFPPKINEKRIDSINAPCEHHDKNNIFGYNLNSYPCCFDKEREEFTHRKRKVSDITKQHILTSDKVLDYQRIGTLPPSLNILFNQLIKKPENNTFYRMGVVQNNSSFLNAILLALDNKINDVPINNSNEFRKYIVNYLNNKPDEFDRLNNGNLSFKYIKLENYTNALLDTNKTIYWNDVLDIVQIITNMNILMLDIPYKTTESTKIPDYDNIRLICLPNITYNDKNKYLVFLKRENTYEILINLITNDKKDEQSSKIIYKFKRKNEDSLNTNVINFLTEYYNSTCVKENVFPESYPFVEMFSFNEIKSILNNTQYTIKGQIINAFKKVYMLLLSNGLLLPIKETGIENIGDVITLQELKNSNKLLDIHEFLELMDNMNKLFTTNNKNNLDILGVFQIKNTDSVSLKNIEINAILTNFGQIIPIKNSFVSPDEFKIMDFNYYDNVDEYLVNHVKDPYRSPAEIYHNYILSIKNDIYNVKQILAKKLSQNEDAKKYIIYKIKATNLSRIKKIDSLVALFNKIKKVEQFNLDDKFLDFIFHHIANDMLNDNKENLLLNNMVISDIFNPNEILKRDSESILLNIEDIKKWLKQHTE